MQEIILILVAILKFWLVAFIIIFPIALCFCRAAKRGDEGNGLINNSNSEED